MSEYRTLRDNIVKDFYMPLLSEAVSYKRAVGYFTSSSLVEISKGIAELAKNGGRILMVASPRLSQEDIVAIEKGYADREKIISDALLREVDIDISTVDYFAKERLNLLANLIANGVLDIKIAFVNSKNGIGMYHEKMGIIEDSEGNRVAFSGSNNETAQGMFCNYETLDTFCSWASEDIRERVICKESAFERIWSDAEPSMNVKKFPNIDKKIIEKFKRDEPNYNIDNEEFRAKCLLVKEQSEMKYEKPLGARIPAGFEFYDYQKEAINNWEKNNYVGIFDMATGTGKTYTGLGAISTLSEHVKDKLAVIIVCPFQHLVDQWVEDIEKFNIEPIIGYSSSPQKNWKTLLNRAILSQKMCKDKSFFCFICTNSTFKSEFVQKDINIIQQPILLVVDEAHNAGAGTFLEKLDDRFKYRLALSATLDRYGDVEGTQKLHDFFGEKCIEYNLERAIDEKKLTPYYYYPIIVYLTEKELEKYREISYEMSQNLIYDKHGNRRLNSYGELLAVKRSRIVAGASNKLNVLRKVIEPYKDSYNILVYCGSASVNNIEGDILDNDEEDIKQIDAVTKILGHEYKMLVSRFTSRENIKERRSIKKNFEGKLLQALVAIKCLDEGVNIPGISTAFILASTNNPKEYIQRRGRVLRRAPGKEYAVIYDFVTLPRDLADVVNLTEEEMKPDKTMVKNELRRIKEFGKISMNMAEAMIIQDEIKDAYYLLKLGEESEEDEYEF